MLKRVHTMNWKIQLYDSTAERETDRADYHVRLGEKMPGYVIVDLEVLDSAKYDIYKRMVPDTVARYGGRFLVRGGKVETLEGDWAPQRLVILEFPSVDLAKAWCESVEYAPAKALRHQSARSRMIVAEGATTT